MSGQYVRHSVEFKREALRRMETCRNVSQLAREVGVRRCAKPHTLANPLEISSFWTR